MNRFGSLAIVLMLLATYSLKAQDQKNPIVEMDTSKGKIKIELFADKAPITVKNFLQYVEDKHFDGTIFHRVIKDFMIQGGGFDKNNVQKDTRPPIKNESANGISNTRGTIAMARTNVPDSATAQFFINVKDNDFLDKANARDNVGYAVFGRVIEGMDVVDQIRNVETGVGKLVMQGNEVPSKDVPTEPVVINSVRVVKQ